MQKVTATLNQTVQGWSNYETRAASLWIINDELNYQTLKLAYRQGSEYYDHAAWLEQELRQRLDEERPEGMFGDLLRIAFDRISWIEIIENNQDIV